MLLNKTYKSVAIVAITDVENEYIGTEQLFGLFALHQLAEKSSLKNLFVIIYSPQTQAIKQLKFESKEIGASTPSLWQLKKRIKAQLNELKPELLIQFTSDLCFSTTIANKIYKIAKPYYLPKQRFGKWLLNRQVKKVGRSQRTKIYNLSAETFVPVEYLQEIANQKSYYREVFADGMHYFLAVLNPQVAHSWKDILKAFSKFKKWLKSNFKMLLMVQAPIPALMIELQQYLYKDDVIVLSHLSPQQWMQIHAAATLVMMPSQTLSHALLLQLYTCAITQTAFACAETVMHQVFEDISNPYLIDSDLPQSSAIAMIECYKNEVERKIFTTAIYEAAIKRIPENRLQQISDTFFA